MRHHQECKAFFRSMVRRLASLSCSRWINMLSDMFQLRKNLLHNHSIFPISNIWFFRGVDGRGGFETEHFLSALQAKEAQVIHPQFRIMMIIFLHKFSQDTWLRSTMYKFNTPFQAKRWQCSLLVSHQLLHSCSKTGQN